MSLIFPNWNANPKKQGLPRPDMMGDKNPMKSLKNRRRMKNGSSSWFAGKCERMKKLKITMDAFVELEDDESIVFFVAKTLRGGRGHLHEVKMKVPEYTTQSLQGSANDV